MDERTEGPEEAAMVVLPSSEETALASASTSAGWDVRWAVLEFETSALNSSVAALEAIVEV